MNDIIRPIYYNPKTGFASLSNLYKKVKEKDPNISISDVRDWLSKQATYQVNRQDKKPKMFNSIYAPKPFYNFQIDIIVYDRFEVDKYKYILCVVDTYSRYAVCKALTNRENPTIVKMLEEIFKEMGGVPERVNCDNEFDTTLINNLWKKHNVRVYYSNPSEVNKNSIVERFNRTLITLLQKFRTATNGTRKWYKYLPDLVENYNTRIHSTIKETPKDVFEGKVGSRQVVNVVDETPLQVGDKVRIKIIRKVFDKGSEIHYSDQVYIIDKKQGQKYYLRDENGDVLSKPYKPYELRKANEIEHYEYEDDNEPTTPKDKSKQRTARNMEKSLSELRDYTTASDTYKEKNKVDGKRKPKRKVMFDL